MYAESEGDALLPDADAIINGRMIVVLTQDEYDSLCGKGRKFGPKIEILVIQSVKSLQGHVIERVGSITVRRRIALDFALRNNLPMVELDDNLESLNLGPKFDTMDQFFLKTLRSMRARGGSAKVLLGVSTYAPFQKDVVFAPSKLRFLKVPKGIDPRFMYPFDSNAWGEHVWNAIMIRHYCGNEKVDFVSAEDAQVVRSHGYENMSQKLGGRASVLGELPFLEKPSAMTPRYWKRNIKAVLDTQRVFNEVVCSSYVRQGEIWASRWREQLGGLSKVNIDKLEKKCDKTVGLLAKECIQSRADSSPADAQMDASHNGTSSWKYPFDMALVLVKVLSSDMSNALRSRLRCAQRKHIKDVIAYLLITAVCRFKKLKSPSGLCIQAPPGSGKSRISAVILLASIMAARSSGRSLFVTPKAELLVQMIGDFKRAIQFCGGVLKPFSNCLPVSIVGSKGTIHNIEDQSLNNFTHKLGAFLAHLNSAEKILDWDPCLLVVDEAHEGKKFQTSLRRRNCKNQLMVFTYIVEACGSCLSYLSPSSFILQSQRD